MEMKPLNFESLDDEMLFKSLLASKIGSFFISKLHPDVRNEEVIQQVAIDTADFLEVFIPELGLKSSLPREKLIEKIKEHFSRCGMQFGVLSKDDAHKLQMKLKALGLKDQKEHATPLRPENPQDFDA